MKRNEGPDLRSMFLLFSRKGSAEDPGSIMLGEPLSDSTSRDPASSSETAGGNSGVRLKV